MKKERGDKDGRQSKQDVRKRIKWKAEIDKSRNCEKE